MALNRVGRVGGIGPHNGCALLFAKPQAWFRVAKRSLPLAFCLGFHLDLEPHPVYPHPTIPLLRPTCLPAHLFQKARQPFEETRIRTFKENSFSLFPSGVFKPNISSRPLSPLIVNKDSSSSNARSNLSDLSDPRPELRLDKLVFGRSDGESTAFWNPLRCPGLAGACRGHAALGSTQSLVLPEPARPAFGLAGLFAACWIWICGAAWVSEKRAGQRKLVETFS